MEPYHAERREFIKLVIFSDIFILLGYALAHIEELL